MSGKTVSSSDYIQHHLHHWQLDVKTMSIIPSDAPSHGFWVLNLDTLLVSIFLGVIFYSYLKIMI